jgi:hypothetical protein
VSTAATGRHLSRQSQRSALPAPRVRGGGL